jgi:hypothetical protein
MKFMPDKLAVSTDKVKDKSGYYDREGADRIEKIHEVFKNMSGSITQGKAESSGLREQDIMKGVGIKETGLGTSKRGYVYNFDDSEEQKKYKGQAMVRGKNIALVAAMKQKASDIAKPGFLFKLSAPTFAKKELQHEMDSIKKDTDIAAGFTVMQDKMSRSKNLREGLQAWRGRGKEKAYHSDVIALAKSIKN